jgi:protein TonB
MTTLTATGEEGDGIAPPIMVPPDLRPDEGPSGADRRGRLRRWSIAAAALLHAAVLVWLLWDWRRAPPEPPPPVLAVTLVPPPAPAPAAAPPKPAAPEPSPKFRESGKDERTTAPATAETEGPQATTPPEAAPAPKPPAPPLPAERPGTLPAPSGAKAAHEPAVPMLRKPGPRTTAPRKAPARPQIELGEHEETGDPYLNRLRDLIERHRLYPPAAVPLGLRGVADYNVLIDRAGHLVGITLTRSSGTPILDEAGVHMIRDAAPFPPLPPGYPGQAVMISITLPIFPPGAR